MSNRRQSINVWLLAALLILSLCISACDNGSSSHSSQAKPEYYTAVAGDEMYSLNGEGDMAPTADEMDDGSRDVAREIEEADIIKVDGTRLYILNQYRGLYVCDIANPDSPSIMGRLAISGEPVDMYIRDGRAYVIVSLPQYLYYGIMETGGGMNNGIPTEGSRVTIADVSNPANPSALGTVSLEGRVTDSRIVGDILYVVSSEDFYYGWLGDAGGIIRSVTGETDGRQSYVASINIANPASAVEVDRETLEGASDYIHVTDAAIFVPSMAGYYSADRTTVTYVDISDPAGDIRKRGNITFPGSVQDKFKMDYAGGYFRVCSYEWNEEGGKSSLRVIDVNDPDNMAVTGTVELGHGEQLFATRFDGNRAYMVTFEQVDPLWVIDLSDPANPQIAGELTVPGWSTYIEPKGDRLIALGVDNENGWQVSVSLFDVTDPAGPSLVDRVSFGDQTGWSSSTAYDDVKALTIIDEMGLILLPYSTSSWTNDQYAYEERLQLVDFTADDLQARGWVTQEGSVLRSRTVNDRLFSVSGRQLQVINAADRDKPVVTASLGLMENIVDFEPLNSQYGVRVVQDDMGVTTLQAVPMRDPEYGTVAGQIDLESGDSFVALYGAGDKIYVVSNYWNYPGDGQIYRYDIYYEGATRVTVYDFANAAAPVKRGRVELEGSYYTAAQPDIYGLLYPYNYSQGEFLRLGQNAFVFVKPPRNNDYPILYADAEGGDDGTDVAAAVARSVTEDEGAGDEGDAGGDVPMLISTLDTGEEEPILISPYVEPGEGEEPVLISEPETEEPQETEVTVVDLSNADAPVVAAKTVLARPEASGYFVNGSTLCYSYFEEQEEKDELGRPRTQYFLGRLDLSDMSVPTELAGINIPGLCLGLNAAGDTGYTLNMEWVGTTDSRAFSFNTIQLDGDAAYALGQVDLGTTDYGWYYGYDYLLTGSRTYFTGFGQSSADQTVLKVIDTADPANLKTYDHPFSAGSWMYLMEASGTDVFLRVSDSIACYNLANPAVLTLDGYRSPGGWGNRIVFAGGNAYVPMGYYGLWVKSMN